MTVRDAAYARRIVWQRLEEECTYLLKLSAGDVTGDACDEFTARRIERALKAVRNTINCRVAKMLKAEAARARR